MPAEITMTDKQHVSAGLTLLDADNQPITSLPKDGTTVTFVSSDPTIADFVPDESGINGDVTSGKVGQAIITSTVTLPDQTVITDTLTVNVTNSKAAQANFTVGTPADEA